MPYTVTSIERSGKEYRLTIDGEDGEKLVAVIPPKMHQPVVQTMQEDLARQQSELAASFGGLLGIEVVRSAPGTGRNVPGERTLAIETTELGAWALRMARPVIEGMIDDLKSLLGSDPQLRH